MALELVLDMRGDVRWDGDCQRRRAHWRLEGIVGLLFVLMEPLIERIDASIYRGGLVSMTDRITKRTSPQKRAENGKIAGSERSCPLNRRLADCSETHRPLAIERRFRVDSSTPARPAGSTRWVGAKAGRWRMADGDLRMAMMSVEE